jgi:hypothetical protein
MSEGMNFSLSSDASITVVGVEDYEKCYVRAFSVVWAPTRSEARRMAREELQLALVRDGEDVTVAVTKPDDWDTEKNRLSIRYAVMLTRRSNIDIVSTHGDVEIINMDGRFSVVSQRGEGFCMGCGSQGTMSGKSAGLGGHHP